MKKKKNKNKKFSALRLIWKIIIFTITILMVTTAVGMGIFMFKYGDKLSKYSSDARKAVEESSIETFNPQNTGNIYYDDGTIMANLRQGKDTRYIPFDKLPKNVKNAFIAVEDRRFYQHGGVDFKGIARALYTFVKSKGKTLHGASTITQQLARNIFLTHEVSLDRKMKEAFIALDLERKYTKDQILEFYINNIYFGHNYYGIGAAANGYFNKKVDKLSLAQIAFLASIPNNPTHYDPIENYDNTQLRKEKILKDMKSYGFISEEEYDKAMKQKIKLKPSATYMNNYETTYAVECAARYMLYRDGFKFRYSFDDMKDYKAYMENYNDAMEQSKHRLYTEGYKIKTSINKDAQAMIQEQINKSLSVNKQTAKNGIYTFQGAATCIDNESHKVVAIVGGRGQNVSSYTLNRAFQAYRQPGSSIKPIVVYTPAIENGYTKKTIVNDSKIKDGPSNAGNAYLGEIPLETAVQKSKNVVAWTLFQELGPKVGLSYAQNMDFRRIVPRDYVLSSALGGLSYGTTTEEMAGAFSTLVNDGTFYEPTCITSIINSKTGKELYTPVQPKRVYSAAASEEMLEILRGVFTKGTAVRVGWNNSKIQAAGKTGTTNDLKDGWFCGVTPYYSIAVWVGYDIPKPTPGLWGSSFPAYIWKNSMVNMIAGKPPKAFATNNIGGEKIPTNESEYAKSHTFTTEVNNKDEENANKVSAILDKLTALPAGKNERAKDLYSKAEALIESIEDNELKTDYANELKKAYSDYKKKKPDPVELDPIDEDEDPIILPEEPSKPSGKPDTKPDTRPETKPEKPQQGQELEPPSDHNNDNVQHLEPENVVPIQPQQPHQQEEQEEPLELEPVG